MNELIARDDAIDLIETRQKELCPVGRYGRRKVAWADRGKYDAWQEIIDALEALPTINPEDLRPKGRNTKKEWPSLFECSVCGWSDWDTFTGDSCTYNYCPNCGAKMNK